MPKILWISWEGGKLESMIKGILGKTELTMTKESYNQQVQKVATDVGTYIQMKEGGHNKYGLGYLMAQVSHVIGCYYYLWS